VGSGFDKGKKPRSQWARDAVEWVDRYVFYRPRRDVLRSFERRFEIVSAEEHYLAYRLSLPPLLTRPLRLLCRRLNGVVLVGRKRPS